jgi:gamma-glutamyltranspeptidase
MQILLAVALFTQAGAVPPVRDPAFARDGRLVVAVEGDLWLRDAAGRRWSRLTSGPAWDRQPAWSPDGAFVVFVSDREQNTDLWRLSVSRAGQPTAPQRLTSDPAADVEPTVVDGGAIVFVRGRGAAARLWTRSADGSERRLTSGESAERWPVASPDGRRVAYIQFADAGRRLRVRAVEGRSDSIVVSDRAPERPAWSPDGTRLAFYSASPRAAIYVAPLDGRYVNVASVRQGVPAWSPDGRTILVGARLTDEAGYNGDPDRVGDRTSAESFAPAPEALVRVQAPVAPDESPDTVAVTLAIARADRNTEAFDRVWSRVDRVYFGIADAAVERERWRALRETYRPRAREARSDAELERVLHALLRERPPLRREASGRAAVSSAHPVATEAGLEILRKGGNVVDAAVAVSFALGVVEPDASGIGGYGEMLVHMTGMERPALIEFMARVPEEASLGNAALLENGRYPADGPILAMVPGTVAGMHTAWQRHGSRKVPWADLLAPAIRAARDGYVVSDGLATTLERERESFGKYESSRALFFRDGRPLRAGDTLRNPDLAWALEQIARRGADGFYRGAVAQRLVGDLRGKGNAMRLTDLARYYAADREPITGTYRGLTVYSAAPPASGGTTLIAQLSLFEHFATPRSYPEDAATLHAMIAAWQLVPSGRGRVGDPGLWPVNTEPFSNKDTARVRWKCFDPSRAISPRVLANVAACDSTRRATNGRGFDDAGAAEIAAIAEECHGEVHAAGAICRASGTTAFAVADADGNVVAVTQTLGTWGGNFYVTPGLGFLYNDKLTSYGTNPDAYGARLPYARHGSTLAPTIVFRGNGTARRPILAVGAAGNAWITSAVYQTLVGVVDFGLSPQRALELPRFLAGGRGGGPGGAATEVTITVEDGIAPDVMAQLRSMGYRFNLISLKGELRMGYGAAVAIGDGTVTAGGDPRRSGTAGAVAR